ncbi:MAG: hypothetical protein IJX96_05950 [Clostridia bacterium]|nr:hypothetical protein [Clostridia bacterium]
MKRIFLAVTAFCFVCSIAILIIGARSAESKRSRPTAPVFEEQRYYRLAP